MVFLAHFLHFCIMDKKFANPAVKIQFVALIHRAENSSYTYFVRLSNQTSEVTVAI